MTAETIALTPALLSASYSRGRTRMHQQQSSVESLENHAAESLRIHLSTHMAAHP